MATHIWKSLNVGAERRWFDALRSGFGAVGAVWTITEVTTKAFKPLDAYVDTHGYAFMGIMVLLFVLVFLAFVLEPVSVTFKVPLPTLKLRYSMVIYSRKMPIG